MLTSVEAALSRPSSIEGTCVLFNECFGTFYVRIRPDIRISGSWKCRPAVNLGTSLVLKTMKDYLPTLLCLNLWLSEPQREDKRHISCTSYPVPCQWAVCISSQDCRISQYQTLQKPYSFASATPAKPSQLHPATNHTPRSSSQFRKPIFSSKRLLKSCV